MGNAVNGMIGALIGLGVSGVFCGDKRHGGSGVDPEPFPAGEYYDTDGHGPMIVTEACWVSTNGDPNEVYGG